MAGITLAQAEAQLANWLAASTAVSKGQSYVLSGTTFTRADAAKIQSMIEFWDKKCEQLSGSSNVARKIRVYGATPV
jgi:hypothetical protein